VRSIEQGFVPAAVDWTTENAVTPVKNQGQVLAMLIMLIMLIMLTTFTVLTMLTELTILTVLTTFTTFTMLTVLTILVLGQPTAPALRRQARRRPCRGATSMAVD
jgi:hypothetical protein